MTLTIVVRLAIASFATGQPNIYGKPAVYSTLPQLFGIKQDASVHGYMVAVVDGLNSTTFPFQRNHTNRK